MRITKTLQWHVGGGPDAESVDMDKNRNLVDRCINN